MLACALECVCVFGAWQGLGAGTSSAWNEEGQEVQDQGCLVPAPRQALRARGKLVGQSSSRWV